MAVRLLLVQILCFSLCACSSGRQIWVMEPSRSFAFWTDHSNQLPARQRHHRIQKPTSKETSKSEEKPKIEDQSAIEREEAELDSLPKYSHEWVARRRQIDAEEDARITKILSICRGCGTDSDPRQATGATHSISEDQKVN